MLTNFDHMEMMTCQIAQTKRKCSSDELLNGSNNKEIIILKKIKSGCFVWNGSPKLQTISSDEN